LLEFIAQEVYVTCTAHFMNPRTLTLHNFHWECVKHGNSTAVDLFHYAEGHMSVL